MTFGDDFEQEKIDHQDETLDERDRFRQGLRRIETGEWKWLASTMALQTAAYGVEYPRPASDIPQSIIENVTSMVAELGEFLQEVGWKPWASDREWVNRDRAAEELVDVAHFLANICCVLGIDDEEWNSRYQAKQFRNLVRQLEGYAGDRHRQT